MRNPKALTQGSFGLASASTFQDEKNSRPQRGIPLEAGPVGIMGKMPMPRHPRIGSFSSASLRLCVVLLFPASLPRQGGVPAREGGITADKMAEQRFSPFAEVKRRERVLFQTKPGVSSPAIST